MAIPVGRARLNAYAKKHGWTVRSLPAATPLGERYQYNLRGAGGNMYARNLTDARHLIACAGREYNPSTGKWYTPRQRGQS
jgi:hypothetical protein